MLVKMNTLTDGEERQSVNILNVQNVLGSLGKLLKNPVSYRKFSYVLMEPSRPWEDVGMVGGGGGGNSAQSLETVFQGLLTLLHRVGLS